MLIEHSSYSPEMQRANKLRDIWDYLPAFRAVAETQHLPTAAKALRVSASALSRSISILEDRLDTRLFERGGRRMQLTPAGTALLLAVRGAMRIVDESVGALDRTGLNGTVTIGYGQDAAFLWSSALAHLRQHAPALSPRIARRPSDVRAALLRGDVDIVVGEPVAQSDELLVEEIAAMPWSVYGVNARIQAPAFIAVADDPLPAAYRSRVVATVDDLGIAALACRDDLVAWLPDVVATNHRLVRVPPFTPVKRSIWVVYRAPVGSHPRTEAALAALRFAASRKPRPALPPA
ncbi:MAG: LysR family transcriptional regulator [Kofleriaceae bacterium]